MSAVGTILLQSPGWNEGKARYETLGFEGNTKNKSSVGAALTARAFALCLGSATPLGLNKCIDYYYPGLGSWAMQECRPCRAHLHSLVVLMLP